MNALRLCSARTLSCFPPICFSTVSSSCCRSYTSKHNIHSRSYCCAPSKDIVYEKRESIVTIGLNRGHKKNAVDRSTAIELSSALRKFEDCDDSLVAILHGIGGSFCSGYDLTEVGNTGSERAPIEFEAMFRQTNGAMGGTHLTLKKPIIAAVSGYAVAGGLELALLCTLRVVEQDAIFGVFCRKHGVPLIDGGTVRLPKLIGLSRAMDMIVTGREVNADEALQFGLANRVVPTGEGMKHALKIAHDIIQFPQLCMLTDMASANYATFEATSKKDALTYELQTGLAVLQEESVAGAKKFVDRTRSHPKTNS